MRWTAPALLLAALALADAATAKLQLDTIRTGLPKSKHQLKKFMAQHQSAAEKDPKLADLYNEAVSLARAHKLKASYLTKPLGIGWTHRKKHYLVLDQPQGSRWAWAKRSPIALEVVAGVLTRGTARTVRIAIFGIRGGASPGTPQQQAEIGLMGLKRALRDPKVSAPAARRRFNRRLGKCFSFVVAGLDSKGEFQRYRNYYFPARSGIHAGMAVSVIEYDAKPDPELEAILASIREP